MIASDCDLTSSAPHAAATTPVPMDSLTVSGRVGRARNGWFEAHSARRSALPATREAEATGHNAKPRLSGRSGQFAALSGFYDPAETDLGQHDLRLVTKLGPLDGGQLRRKRDRTVAAANRGACT